MSLLNPDFECTWWPDTWFGISLTPCCIEHDLGGTDLELWQCIATLHPAFSVLATVMIIGVILGRPIYRLSQRNKKDDGKNADNISRSKRGRG